MPDTGLSSKWRSIILCSTIALFWGEGDSYIMSILQINKGRLRKINATPDLAQLGA